MPSSREMAKAMPPLAVPSSLAMRDVGDVDRLGEHLGLHQAVLAGRGVDDQQHLMRRFGDVSLHDAADLLELLHQVVLGVQPAGGVDDQDVGVAVMRRLHAVEDDGAGVGVGLVRDDRRRRARSPQTFSWSMAAARKVSPATSITLRPTRWWKRGQLGDRRRLAGAVDADDQR